MQALATVTMLVGVLAAVHTFDVSYAAFTAPDAQAAQVYSSLQGTVQAFLGLGGSRQSGAGAGPTYNSTTPSYYGGQYESFGGDQRFGGDPGFAGSEEAYASYNGFPTGNYDGSLEGGPTRQTASGVQTTGSSATARLVQSIAGTTVNTAADTSGGAITGTNPAVACIPGVVQSGEPAMIFYACGDTSTTSTGEGFETAGAVSGKTRVYPTATKTFGVACSEGTSTECIIEVLDPRLSIIATPRTIARGGNVDITWTASDVSQCLVKSSTQANFVREGIKGDTTSPSMAQNTTYTLVCETDTGTIVSDEVVVTVQ